MVRYQVSCQQAQQRYIQFSAVFVQDEHTTELQLELPSWRPGRYELGNFAKSIKGFKAFGNNNQPVAFEKTTKDTWLLQTAGHTEIKISYSYYAAELNAGSTFLDPKQLYVNPVNCFFYDAQQPHQAYELTLELPTSWKIASALRFDENHSCMVANFDRLADSPFICSAQLECRSYQVNGIDFHICFNGQQMIPWERVINDFQRFTQKQCDDFGEFPSSNYTFLIQSLPYAAYHGVEHLDSTVIALGPSCDVFSTLYTELLGVSSHELYHAWNIKALRPAEMLPYDFKRENYAVTGFIYEGITTYLGDLYLLKSGVFSIDQYLKELSKQLQKHLDNPGRFAMSVAAASFDTWLDGYVPGAPGRKVSIYTEGCLLAFYVDFRLRKATKNKMGLEHLMKTLYFEFGVSAKGYSISAYQKAVENLSGESFDDFFKDYVFGTCAYEALLQEALTYFGLELKQTPSKSYAEARLGMKVSLVGKEWQILQIYPGSPADTGGLALGDLIIGVNGMRALPSLDNWLAFHENQNKTLLIERNGQLLERFIPEVDRHFYVVHEVRQSNDPIAAQQKAFANWANL
ncbi:MAG: M61 family metallopeptidase [Flavobacteriales bacterium]